MTLPERKPADPLQCRAGFTLVAVLILIVTATLIATTAVALSVTEERSLAAAERRARLAAAAGAVVAELQERLLSRAQAVSGALQDADLAALHAEAVAALHEPPPGIGIDWAHTGWRVIEVRENERIPHDEVPVAAWTDRPRITYEGVPPVGGLVAARTVVIAVVATVRDEEGGSYRVRRDLAVSQVPPHQHAVYVAGDAELCASGTPRSWIGGAVRIDGTLVALACPHLLRYAGGIEARDGIEVGEPAAHFIVGSGGERALASVTRDRAAGDPGGLLAAWDGRVRVSAALGGAVGTGRMSTRAVAGSGECDDVPPAGGLTCGGAARYFPSLQIQRTTPGAGPEFSVTCGAAYPEGCGAVAAAIRYHPWPFLAPPLEGVAPVDPADPAYLWRGLLPDARREARCTATVADQTFRTARCATNLYGFQIDLSTLPTIAGGVLSVRRAEGQLPDANPSAAQEIVLLVNASALAGPLTIHSELPVYVAGSFNTRFHSGFGGPPPAMIHAPRVVILPDEAPEQLRTSAVWDSVPRAGVTTPAAQPLRAESNVTVYAVIRSRFCRTAGGSYFGGVWEAVPAVLGDWRAAGLLIVGAIEATDETSTATACTTWAAPLNAPPPSGTVTFQPSSRTVLYDERLLHLHFQPRGSWGHENVPLSGPQALAGRSYERQRRAIGGTVVVRRVRDDERGFPSIPEGVSIGSPHPFPVPPLPLP